MKEGRRNKYHRISSTAEVIIYFKCYVGLKEEDSHMKINKTNLFKCFSVPVSYFLSALQYPVSFW